MDLIRTSKVTDVRILDKYQFGNNNTSSQNDLVGTLYLTATHLIFMEQSGNHEKWILHSHLSSITKRPISAVGTPIHIRCKNFYTVTYVIPKERDAHDLYISLYQISQPIKLTDLYCFQYTAFKEPFQDKREYGWYKFDLLKEFQRQGVSNSSWQLTNLNQNYELCETYPSVLFVPKTATDKMLKASANFRSKKRLPALSYFYKKNNAVICRCSQPLSGLSQRCLEDENLLNCILYSNSLNQKEKFLYVVDTRPMINAMANRATGKGYESINFYENIKFYFFGIENIHVMRGSLQKLIETCEIKVPSINAFFSGINASGWLKHIKSVLETASFVAKTVDSGISVIVHCSDGWDRTAQTCSIAALLLDPYYRTIDGFQSLIEKEWISFGHKFTDRCGYISIGDSKENAPVFTQFIDAVWQITQQFPFEFEFNEEFLLVLHDHVYSCQFGTFIGNCEKERKQINLENLTYSLWAFIESQSEQFINPLYKYRNLDKEKNFLNIQVLPQLIRFWRSMYNRFDFGLQPREKLDNLLTVTYNHTKSLESHIFYLKQKINQMQLLEKNNFKFNLIELNIESKKLSSNSNKIIENSMQISCLDSSIKFLQESMNELKLDINLNNEELNYKNEINNILNNHLNETTYLQFRNLIENNLIQLINCMQLFSLNWQSFRETKKCLCGSSYEQPNEIYHCWCCGHIYCVRCIEKRIRLPGHIFIKNKMQFLNDNQTNQFEKDQVQSISNNQIQKDFNLKLIKLDDEQEATNNIFCHYVPVCAKCYKSMVNLNKF